MKNQLRTYSRIILLLIWIIVKSTTALDWLYFPQDSEQIVSQVFYPSPRLTWAASEVFCREQLGSSNGALGRIRSSEMNWAIVNQSVRSGCWSLWIGLSQDHGQGSKYNEPKGDWCWEDGTCDGYYNNWVDNEPNGGPTENCAIVWTLPGILGYWNDYNCDSTSVNCVLCEANKCPDGLYANPLTGICDTSCDPMKAYYTDTNNFCRYCSPGKFSKSIMPQECNSCPPGRSSFEGSEECFECFAGRYSSESTNNLCELCPAGFGSSSESSSCSQCSPGKYSIRGTGCISCEKGKYSEAFGASVCESCVNEDFMNISSLKNAGSSDKSSCRECNPGYFFSTEQNQCIGCALGKFKSFGMDSCQNCLPGSYSDSISSVLCSLCPEGTWSSTTGSTSIKNCNACPGDTEGSICPAGSSVPYVLYGHYRDLSQPDNIKKCVPRDACLESGYNSTTCSPGYLGSRCSRCEPFKYYRKDRACLKCGVQWPKWLFFGFIFVFLLILTFLVSRPNEKFGDYIRVPLFGLQTLAILPRLTEDLDPTVDSYLRSLSVVNLDFQLFSFDCQVQFSYWTTWILKLCLPIFVAFALLILYGINSNLVRTKSSIVVKRLAFPSSQYVYCFIAMLQFLYLYLLVIIFEPMQCLRQAKGNYTMISYPSVECYTKEWNRFVYYLGVPMIFIYAICIPLLFVFALYKFRHELQSERFKRFFGSLTRPYAPQFFWYEGIVILKKFGIVFLPDLLTAWVSGNVRVLSCVISTIFFLGVDCAFMPYAKAFMNRVNILFCCSALFVLMSSFVTAIDGNASTNEKKFLAILAVLFMILVKSYALFHFFSKIANRRRKKVSTVDQKVVKLTSTL